MAKKGMNIRYKRKRERNKYNPTVNANDSAKNFVTTFLSVALFLGLMGLMVYGMDKLGVFQRGYEAPEKEETKISTEFIPISTVFTRNFKEYYVLFDNYRNEVSKDAYVNELLKGSKIPVYKVDMNRKDNAKYVGEKANKNATKTSELSINDVTLVKITNGRISSYKVGSEEIESYLSK